MRNIIWGALLCACAICHASGSPSALVVWDQNRPHVLLRMDTVRLSDTVSFDRYVDVAAPSMAVRFNAKTLPAYQDAAPGSAWSGSFYYDIANKEISAIVVRTLKELTRHGVPTGWELDGFTGAVVMRDWKSVIGNSKSVIGAAIVYRHEFFDNVSGFAGFGVSAAGGRPVGIGLTAGVGIKF